MRTIPEQKSLPVSGGRDNPGRRDILRAIPVAGLAACLPEAASSAAEKETASSGRDPVYRQTDLIRRYYDRARF